MGRPREPGTRCRMSRERSGMVAPGAALLNLSSVDASCCATGPPARRQACSSCRHCEKKRWYGRSDRMQMAWYAGVAASAAAAAAAGATSSRSAAPPAPTRYRRTKPCTRGASRGVSVNTNSSAACS